MRSLILIVLALSLAAAEDAGDGKGYSLHEWGVFTVAKGNPFAQQDLREEWASFPNFFQRGSPLVQGAQPGPDPNAMARKPVIWLRSEQAMTASLMVGFPRGKPMVWWPAGIQTEQGLHFDLQLTPPSKDHVPMLPPVPADHWLARLRKVPADTVMTIESGRLERRKAAATPMDSLVDYDGIVPAMPEPVVADAKEGWINVTFATGSSYSDLLVVDRRDGTARVSAWIDHIPAPRLRGENGPELAAFTMEAADAALIAKRAKEFVERLGKTGLTDEEAQALVDIWRTQLFEQDGVTVFYRIPQLRYEALLPLQATPEPTSIVRVGIVVHSHLEPDLAERITAQIALLSDAAKREDARKKLMTYGGAAFSALSEAAKTAPLEIARICLDLIAAQDLSPAMERAAAR